MSTGAGSWVSASNSRSARGSLAVGAGFERPFAPTIGPARSRRKSVKKDKSSVCGRALFWKPVDKHIVAVAMGAFDAPTGTRLEMHIFVADKG